jgi:tetratricopeptide (TPR) repeat protein
MDSAAARVAPRNRLLFLVVRACAVAAVLAVGSAAWAQDAGRLEADAKRAFDAGRFHEAGEKYAKAAEAGGLAADRQSDLRFQSAWAYFIAGNSKLARENLKAAYTARPTLEVVADFYSPDFVKLAQAVRAEVTGPAAVPAADVAEVKRTAREKLADGKVDEALYDLKRVEASPDPQVHRLLADVYDRLGKTAEADTERRRSSDLEKGLVTTGPIASPGNPATPGPGAPPAPNLATNVASLVDQADFALKNGDFRGAAALAARATEADSRSAQAHRAAGDAAWGLGQEGDAEREYTAAVVLDSANWRSELGLARLSERQKKWNTAASHYRRALELNGKSVAAALGLGRTLEPVDRTGARIAYGRAVEIDPASADARNDFGVFLFRSEDYDRAIAELIEAVRLSPQRALFHENLGRAYRRQKKLREAEREIAAATRLAPNEVSAWTTLGHLRVELNKAEEAAAAFRAALDLDPTNEEAATGLGDALLSAGRLPEAETALSRAVEAIPRSAILWNNLGVARTRRGEYGPALEAFGRALAIDDSFEPAKTNRARAEQLAAIARSES